MKKKTTTKEQDFTIQGMIDWRTTEEALNEGTESGYKMAILETHKMFLRILKEKQIPGETKKEQYEYVKKELHNDTAYAVNITHSIIHEQHTSLSLEDTKQIIKMYYEAIKSLQELEPKTIKKWKKQYKKQQKRKKKNKVVSILRYSGAAVIGFLFLVFIIDSTEIGRSIIEMLVAIAHFIFTTLLIYIATISIVIAFITGIIQHTKNAREAEFEESLNDDKKPEDDDESK